jgi:hypothetical protein
MPACMCTDTPPACPYHPPGSQIANMTFCKEHSTTGKKERLCMIVATTRLLPLWFYTFVALQATQPPACTHVYRHTTSPSLPPTRFCIFVAMPSVTSAVLPPAPQVMSQKVGPYATIRSRRSNRFSTPWTWYKSPTGVGGGDRGAGEG